MKTKATKKNIGQGMSYLVGLDVGFGELKRISNVFPDPVAIPSAVVPGARPASSKLFTLPAIRDEYLIVTTNEGTFFVGEYAMKVPTSGSKRTQVRDRSSDMASRVLFQTGIALSVPHEDGEYDVTVITGLPNLDYDLSIKKRLQEFLNQSFTVEFHLSDNKSITKTINIIESEVLRQPEGAVTYNQFQFDKDEFLLPSEYARSLIGMIDFGHFTTDYALFQNGVIIENDTVNGSTTGVVEVYNKLRRKLIVKFDEMGYEFQATDQDLDRAVREGVIHYMGEDHNVEEEVTESARESVRTIAKAVLDDWGNETNRLELILVTGGGSHIFQELLKEEFSARRKQNFQIVDAPQFSNVLGFYMYGCISLFEKIGQDGVFNQYIAPVFPEGS